ncbi:MAG: Asp23/Gls24 family envelope stress response protein [Acidimicrobiales bacterium]
MTTVTGVPTTTGSSAPPGVDAAVLAGRTVIAPRALVAIARQAASEIDGVELVAEPGLRRLMAELLPGGGGHGATATVASGTAAMGLHLAICWPRPVAQLTGEVRRHVRDKVQDLTGCRVTEIDIVVDVLPLAGRSRTGRVE